MKHARTVEETKKPPTVLAVTSIYVSPYLLHLQALSSRSEHDGACTESSDCLRPRQQWQATGEQTSSGTGIELPPLRNWWMAAAA